MNAQPVRANKSSNIKVPVEFLEPRPTHLSTIYDPTTNLHTELVNPSFDQTILCWCMLQWNEQQSQGQQPEVVKWNCRVPGFYRSEWHWEQTLQYHEHTTSTRLRINNSVESSPVQLLNVGNPKISCWADLGDKTKKVPFRKQNNSECTLNNSTVPPPPTAVFYGSFCQLSVERIPILCSSEWKWDWSWATAFSDGGAAVRADKRQGATVKWKKTTRNCWLFLSQTWGLGWDKRWQRIVLCIS